MTDVLIVCDEQGRIQRVNAALRGQPFRTLLTADCQSLADSLTEKIRAKAVIDCEVTLRGRGENVPLAMNCSSWPTRR